MRDKVETNVIGLYITSRCTLNCELCASGIPYYEDPHHTETAKILETFSRLFLLYDKVNHADLLGGEPLMHPDIDVITAELFKYRQFVPEFRIITNGTIVPSDNLCKSVRAILDAGTSFLVLLDNYGEHSRKLNEVHAKFLEYGIPVRVDHYVGEKEGQYSGGWVKYGDYLLNNKSAAEISAQWRDCICRDLNYHEVWEGCIYPCAYAYSISALGHDVLKEDEFVDLFDNTSDEERKETLRRFNLTPNSACYYCYSLARTSPRYPAAEQTPRNRVEV
jgi:MoaA/NifB/PqqE/SkfB family radical SAM enzyme